ncbi:hypothetical protein C8J57DRAFT_1212290 [Mycena rebaudengoi]|nr:hypothetical protein C8J57DRAFT_1212290 [Mycena rebaudengoi]
MYYWNWGLPGTVIPFPPGPGDSEPTPNPPDYSQLKFNPLGLYNLRRLQGILVNQPGIYNTHKAKFDAADLAFLAAGASEDNQHKASRATFASAFFALRDSLPATDTGRDLRRRFSKSIQMLLWDLATMWDRTFGSSTIIVHVDGTVAPYTTLTPDRLKASVYLPPLFVMETPESHLAIAHIVQTFIEHVGLPTVNRWTRGARALNWSLTQSGVAATPHQPSARLVPAPRAGTSHYIFHGRPWQNLDPLPTSRPATSSPSHSAHTLMDADTPALVAELEDQIYGLSVDLREARTVANERLDVMVASEHREQQFLAQERQLVAEITARDKEVKRLNDYIAFWQQDLAASSIAAAASSSRTVPSTPTRKKPATQTPKSPTTRSSPFPIPALAYAPTSSHLAVEKHGKRRQIAILGPETDRFLQENRLERVRRDVVAIVSHAKPVKYIEEIAHLDLGPALSKGLLSVMLEDSQDTMHSTTIASVSQPRVRHKEAPARAPLTQEERKEKRDKHEKKQDAVDAAVGDWFQYTYAKGGARMVNHQEKINPYNAFKSEKAAECREQGVAKRVTELHKDYIDEYRSLSEEDKEDLVERFRDVKNCEVRLRRDTPRGRIQDLANTMVGAGHRVGIEGFFCIVRNNANFHVKPHWYFTSLELESYMKIACRQRWDTATVGAKIEVFAVAGSDVLNLLRTSKQKADYLKREIRDLMHDKLVAITGDKHAEMQYVQYEEKIVHHYSIKLVGWTALRLVNPSELSSLLAPLQQLVHALKTDACKFVKLTPVELQERIEKYNTDVAAGVREPLKNHSNVTPAAGKKRCRDRAAMGGVPEDEEEEEQAADDEEGDLDENDPPPLTKRRKTAAPDPTPAPVTEVLPRPQKKAPAKQSARPSAAKKAPAKTAPAKAPAKGPRDDELSRRVLTTFKAKRTQARRSRAIITDSDSDSTGSATPAGTINGTAAPASPAVTDAIVLAMGVPNVTSIPAT